MLYNGHAILYDFYCSYWLHPIRLNVESYYYATETGFYYLQSRYYDPAIGRFINADSFASTGQGFLGYNMFAYCGNNPINYVDMDGYLHLRNNEIKPVCIDDDESIEGALIAGKHSDEPPDHPDFKPPKKGNRKVKVPNGNRRGWIDSKGNIWVWTPGMHGGDGWTIQYPNGNHGHAYPGGGTRTHCAGVQCFWSLPEDNSSMVSSDSESILVLVTVVIYFGILSNDDRINQTYFEEASSFG